MTHPLDTATQALKIQYENVQPNTVDHLIALYAKDAVFKDPFQEVKGQAHIKEIFLKMFEQLDAPKFVVLEVMRQHNSACFVWEFQFQFKRWNTTPKSFTGVSWLKFNPEHLVISHIDFWDPAEGIYEHLPVIGSLMRGLKKLA